MISITLGLSAERLVHASSTNNIASLTKRSTLKNSRVMGSSPNFTELSPRIGRLNKNKSNKYANQFESFVGTPEARFARINGVPYEPSSELLPTIKPHSPYAKQTMKYVEEHFGADDRTSNSATTKAPLLLLLLLISSDSGISLSDPEDYRVKSASPLPPQRSSLPALHDRNTAHWFNKLPTGANLPGQANDYLIVFI